MTGDDLKRRRDALGLSQVELAGAISTPAYRVHQQEISRWESGAVRITPVRAWWLDERLRLLEASDSPCSRYKALRHMWLTSSLRRGMMTSTKAVETAGGG